MTTITNSPAGVRRLLEISGEISLHNIFEFNIFNPYDRRLKGMEHKSFFKINIGDEHEHEHLEVVVFHMFL